MAFDGLMTYTIAKKLQDTILGGKIDKIFEPNENEIVLGVYCNSISYALNIITTSNYYRVCFTAHPKPNPNFAPNFCMALRKYLLNTRITKVETLGLERIIIIEFEGHNKSGDFSPKKLIIELMGKHSNIILLNSDNRIIDALKHFDTSSNSYRDILPNHLYTFPISNKLNFFDTPNEEAFFETIFKYHNLSNENTNLSLSKIISDTYTGISKSSILFFGKELQIPDIFNQLNCYKIYTHIRKILNEDCLAIEFEGNDYFLKCLSSSENTSSILFQLDDYYTQKEYSESFITYRSNLSKLILQHLKRLTNKLNTINEKLKECKNTSLYQLYGELITNNLYRISSEHVEKIDIENYYDNNNIISIPLDKSLTPAENAKRYFKKYTKLKNAKQIVEEQKLEVEQEINYLESIIYELQSAKTLEEIDTIYNEFSENYAPHKIQKQNKKNKSKTIKKSNRKMLNIGEPYKMLIDGFTVLIGKNNNQNDYITKQASPNDIWFHTKDIHGSHVILKTDNKSPSQETINTVASITAFFSKASKSSNVSVDYTYAKYVKKPANSKPGMVVYTNYKNVIVKPKEMP